MYLADAQIMELLDHFGPYLERSDPNPRLADAQIMELLDLTLSEATNPRLADAQIMELSGRSWNFRVFMELPHMCESPISRDRGWVTKSSQFYKTTITFVEVVWENKIKVQTYANFRIFLVP